MSETGGGCVGATTRRSFLAGAAGALVGLTLGPAAAAGRQPSSKPYEFIDGRWFDGRKFRDGRFYSHGGVLTTKRPARVERVFDLAGRYVVPPFGEAHNHNLDWSSDANRASCWRCDGDRRARVRV